MARKLFNGLECVLQDALSSSDTLPTFTGTPRHSGPAGPTLSASLTSGDYVPMSILDATTGVLREIVHLSSTGGVWAITRGEEGTTGVTHPAGAILVCSILTADL